MDEIMRIFRIKVKPSSRKTEIISETRNEMTLAVAAPAENNKANMELIKFLSRHFGADVEITSGLKSKTKIVKIY